MKWLFKLERINNNLVDNREKIDYNNFTDITQKVLDRVNI